MQSQGRDVSQYGRSIGTRPGSQNYGSQGGRGDLYDTVREYLDNFFESVGFPSSLGGGRQRLIGQIGGQSGLSGLGGQSIPMDITETPQAILVHAELPGLSEQDIEITVSDGSGGTGAQQNSANSLLTLRAHREHESWRDQPGGQQGSAQGREQRNQYHRVERYYGELVRSFQLPPGIDLNQITANFDRGVLTLTLPKTQDSQRNQRRIEVRQGAPSSTTSRS